MGNSGKVEGGRYQGRGYIEGPYGSLLLCKLKSYKKERWNLSIGAMDGWCYHKSHSFLCFVFVLNKDPSASCGLLPCKTPELSKQCRMGV